MTEKLSTTEKEVSPEVLQESDEQPTTVESKENNGVEQGIEETVHPSEPSEISPEAQKIINHIIKRKVVDKASWATIAKEVNIPKSTLFDKFGAMTNQLAKEREARLIQESQPQAQFEENVPRGTIEEAPLILQGPTLPPGGIILTQDLITAIRQGLSATQKRVFDSALSVAAQRQIQTLRNNGGEGLPIGARNPEDAFWIEMAKSEKIERAFRMRDRMQRGPQNPLQGNALKTTLEAIKIGVGLAGSGGPDPLKVYRDGRKDEGATQQAIRQAGGTRGGSTNQYDLNLEKLRESHDIDMMKLDWEMKKYFLGLEADKDKWSNITKTFSPFFEMAAPQVKKTMQKVGQSIGQNIERIAAGQGNPNLSGPTEPFTCPDCKAGFSIPKSALVNRENAKVVCPACKAVHNLALEEETERRELRPKSRLEPTYS